jgi:hypothetical protein
MKTVAQFIEELKAYPPDVKIVVRGWDQLTDLNPVEQFDAEPYLCLDTFEVGNTKSQKVTIGFD